MEHIDYNKDRAGLQIKKWRKPTDRNSQLLACGGVLWYSGSKEVFRVETKDILSRLRTERGLSQDELAEQMFVTRQAVSRWENGETTPNVETLKRLSQFFDVSINTLLGSPRTLVCQSCGMPLNDDILAKNTDGSFNEQYCMWCWDGESFAQDCTMEEMVEQCLPHMPLGRTDPEACRAYMRSLLPTLGRWKEN